MALLSDTELVDNDQTTIIPPTLDEIYTKLQLPPTMDLATFREIASEHARNGIPRWLLGGIHRTATQIQNWSESLAYSFVPPYEQQLWGNELGAETEVLREELKLYFRVLLQTPLPEGTEEGEQRANTVSYKEEMNVMKWVRYEEIRRKAMAEKEAKERARVAALNEAFGEMDLEGEAEVEEEDLMGPEDFVEREYLCEFEGCDEAFESAEDLMDHYNKVHIDKAEEEDKTREGEGEGGEDKEDPDVQNDESTEEMDVIGRGCNVI